tara:strand:+ start:12915 stop:15215 length:2301 start_codon:yes stop_codon:yes gene_type:complete
MAKKQTLKSLLGGSDDRVQVSYDPSEITLSPTVQQARGSSTVVQAMPRTNQALNFANALNQVPQVMGQMKNIGQAQALEDFSQLSSDERDAAMADDKTISKWLGYDKAFQEELVKDYFVRNQKSITKRFTNLANNPAQYESDQGFDDAITTEKNTLIEELKSQFGKNPNRVLAINAFGDQVMTKVIGATTEMYETNKINYALDIKGSHLSDQIKEGVDPSTAFKVYLDDIKSIGDVDNKKAKEEFVTNTFAIGTELRNKGQHTKAAEVVQAALDYQFYKGAKVSGEERTKLSNLLEGIQDDRDSTSTTTINQASARIAGLYASTAQTMYGNNGELSEVEENSVKQLLTRLDPQVAGIEEFIQELSNLDNGRDRANLLRLKLQEIGTSADASDFTMDVYALSGDNILNSLGDLNNLSPRAFTGISDEELSQLEGAASKAFKDFPDLSAKNFMTSNGYGDIKYIPDSILSAYNEAHQTDFLDTIPAYENLKPTFVKNMIDEAFLSVDSGLRASEFSDSASVSAVQITMEVQREIKEYATTLVNEPDINKRNELITTRLNELLKENIAVERMIFEGESIFEKSIKYGDIKVKEGLGLPSRPGDREDVLNRKAPQAGTIGGKIETGVEQTTGDYEHLNKLNKFIKDGFRANIPTLTDYFDKAYTDMRAANDTQALTATMLAYGYPSFDTLAASDLERTKLRLAEVRLFGTPEEFVSITDNFGEVLEKITEDVDLNDEETETFETMVSFGITDIESFDYFRTVQSDLLLNP